MNDSVENGLCKHHYELVEKIAGASSLFKWALIIILAAMGFVAVFLHNGQAKFQELLINPRDGLLIQMNQKLDSHLASWPSPNSHPKAQRDYDGRQGPNPRTGN